MAKIKKETRKNYHHLGSPEVVDAFYHKDNMEFTILLSANGSNETFLNEMDEVQMGDELYLGLSEEDAEILCETLITALSKRYEEKVKKYNEYKKAYWMNELDGNEDDWNSSNWNSFKEEE